MESKVCQAPRNGNKNVCAGVFSRLFFACFLRTSGDFLIFGLTKRPFGDFYILRSFLSKF